MKVELTVPTNYAAVVEALVADQVDFAYLGGFTYVQAHQRAGVLPLVQREGDRHFHSLLITRTGSPIHGIADLAGKTFSFGDVNSTSGHLMPDYFLRQAGHDPATFFGAVQYSGGHDATVLAVANGKVDAGAVDETVYKTMLAKGVVTPQQVRVFYTTPDFLDYVWVARKGLAPATREKLARAYLALSPATPEGKQLLELLRGKKFVRADDASYGRLREAAKATGLLR
jgi:phosphonate transport system substrate-binding protein